MASNIPKDPYVNIHDKCKQVVLFHNNICNFFKSLKGVLPECSKLLKKTIDLYKTIPRAQYIKLTIEKMEPHIKYISTYDLGIFTEDYSSTLELLPLMDFREIWPLLNAEDFLMDPALKKATIKSLFNHLQTIFISATMASQQICVFDRNMDKQKALLINMIDNLKLDSKVKDRVSQMKTQEAQEAQQTDGGMAGLGGIADVLKRFGNITGGNIDSAKGLFTSLEGEDNFIYKLAQDILDELDMGAEDIENPLASIMSLFEDGGKKIQDIIVKIGDKLESKLASGEINREQLMQDAQKMKDKFTAMAPEISEMLDGDLILKAHYENLSETDKQQFKDIPDILQKPMKDRTPEEQERCMSMPGVAS